MILCFRSRLMSFKGGLLISLKPLRNGLSSMVLSHIKVPRKIPVMNRFYKLAHLVLCLFLKTDQIYLVKPPAERLSPNTTTNLLPFTKIKDVAISVTKIKNMRSKQPPLVTLKYHICSICGIVRYGLRPSSFAARVMLPLCFSITFKMAFFFHNAQRYIVVIICNRLVSAGFPVSKISGHRHAKCDHPP